MPNQLHKSYRESRILTASSHNLHLMLIEGAIRFGRQAEAAMQRQDYAAASEPLLHSLDIVGELVVGVRGSKTELNRRIADLYLYLFRCVSEAKVNDDAEKLTTALRLLEYERDTWRLVCQKLNSELATADNAGSDNHTQASSSERSTAAPLKGTSGPVTTLGVSLEA
jgi:flagellar secretion chaperone FliS